MEGTQDNTDTRGQTANTQLVMRAAGRQAGRQAGRRAGGQAGRQAGS